MITANCTVYVARLAESAVLVATSTLSYLLPDDEFFIKLQRLVFYVGHMAVQGGPN